MSRWKTRVTSDATHYHATELQMPATRMSRRHFKILVAVGFWLLAGCVWIAFNANSYSRSVRQSSVVGGMDSRPAAHEDRDLDWFADFRLQPQVNRRPDVEIDAIVRRNKAIDEKKRAELLGFSNFGAEMKQRHLPRLPGGNFEKDGSSFQLGKGVVTYPVKSPNTTQLVLLDPQKVWLEAEGSRNGTMSQQSPLMHSKAKESGVSLKHSEASAEVPQGVVSNKSVWTNETLVGKQHYSGAQGANKSDPALAFANEAKGLGRGNEKYPTRASGEHLQPEQPKEGDHDEQGKGPSLVGKKGHPTLDNGTSKGNFSTSLPPVVQSSQTESYSNIEPVFNSSQHGKFVVSMTLYGDAQRYTVGALRNAELIKQNFPGWTLRIYTEMPSDKPKFGLVPQNMINTLRGLGADIQYVVTHYDPIPPMMWRFLVADDPAVERFIIRDSDARLTERDAAAVQAWIESGKAFNCIRDHPSHAGYAVSGGLWGGWTPKLRRVIRHTWREMMLWKRKTYLEDMNFLNTKIWPLVEKHAYCSDSVSCDTWPGSYPFPVARYGYEHVGQVMDQHDLGRPQDVSILRSAGENPKCVPLTGQLLGRKNRH